MAHIRSLAVQPSDARPFRVDGTFTTLLFSRGTINLGFFTLVGFLLFYVGESLGVSGNATATQTALSATWSIAATALVAWGLRTGNGVLRAAGLALFGVTAGKVIGIDLWPQLDTLGRVISCSLLGVVLIAVAAGYQFFFTRDRRTA